MHMYCTVLYQKYITMYIFLVVLYYGATFSAVSRVGSENMGRHMKIFTFTSLHLYKASLPSQYTILRLVIRKVVLVVSVRSLVQTATLCDTRELQVPMVSSAINGCKINKRNQNPEFWIGHPAANPVSWPGPSSFSSSSFILMMVLYGFCSNNMTSMA